jgi:uncharacterized small protein (TIGR04563 family)
MALTEKQKQSLYFTDEVLREIFREANRLDRSLSWIVQQAWRLARQEIQTFPAAAVPRERPGRAERSGTSSRRRPGPPPRRARRVRPTKRC